MKLPFYVYHHSGELIFSITVTRPWVEIAKDWALVYFISLRHEDASLETMTFLRGCGWSSYTMGWYRKKMFYYHSKITCRSICVRSIYVLNSPFFRPACRLLCLHVDKRRFTVLRFIKGYKRRRRSASRVKYHGFPRS